MADNEKNESFFDKIKDGLEDVTGKLNEVLESSSGKIEEGYEELKKNETVGGIVQSGESFFGKIGEKIEDAIDFVKEKTGLDDDQKPEEPKA